MGGRCTSPPPPLPLSPALFRVLEAPASASTLTPPFSTCPAGGSDSPAGTSGRTTPDAARSAAAALGMAPTAEEQPQREEFNDLQFWRPQLTVPLDAAELDELEGSGVVPSARGRDLWINAPSFRG